jgi:hypothetical protein
VQFEPKGEPGQGSGFGANEPDIDMERVSDLPAIMVPSPLFSTSCETSREKPGFFGSWYATLTELRERSYVEVLLGGH